MTQTSPMKEFDEWLDKKFAGGGGLSQRRLMTPDQILIARIAWMASRGITHKESRALDEAIGYSPVKHVSVAQWTRDHYSPPKDILQAHKDAQPLG